MMKGSISFIKEDETDDGEFVGNVARLGSGAN